MTQMTDDTVTLAGNLSDIDDAGQTLTISGTSPGPVVTDSQGNFCFTVPRFGLGVVGVSDTDLWGQTSNFAQFDVGNTPAGGDVTFAAQILPGQKVQLSGNVSGSQASGATVIFTGAASGSVTADGDGNFTLTTAGVSLGTVYAFASTQNTPFTPYASADISVNPSITLNLADVTGNTVTLSGVLTDPDPAGQTVSISGAPSDSVVTDDQGNFSFNVPRFNTGLVSVSATDLWGQTSNTAQFDVSMVTPPDVPLTTDVQVLPGQEVNISGMVLSSQAAGATVSFSGAVNGSVIADDAGNYTFTANTASLGTVNVVASAQGTPVTPTVTVNIAVDAPSVTLSMTQMTDDTVTLAGTLKDIDAAGQTLTISGASPGPVVTDGQGNFSFTVPRFGLGVVGVSETDLWGQASNVAQVDVGDAPSDGYVTIATQVLPGQEVQLTGRVSSDQAADSTVIFSGAATGSTTADYYGEYSFTATAASVGTVYVFASNQGTPFTPYASDEISVSPSITLNLADVSDNTVTLSGTLTDPDPAGQTVTVNGATTAPVVTDDQGNFSFDVPRFSTGLVSVSETDLWNQTSTAQFDVSTVPPPAFPLTADLQVLPGQQVTISGMVLSSGAAGATVNFSGAVNGSVSADGLGNYTFTTNTASLGTINVTTTAPGGDMGQPVALNIAVDPPSLTLNMTQMTDDTVTLAGTLTDIDAAGQALTITGASPGAVVTDAQGNFSFTVPRFGLGVVGVSETDLWGQASNVAQVDVGNAPAGGDVTISAQVLSGHVVQLSGNVSGAAAAGATVIFSGAASGSVTADGNGNFTFSTTDATQGTVYAFASNGGTPFTPYAPATVTVPNPSVTLAVTNLTADTITLSGTLTDVDPAGQTLAVSGAAPGPVVTDANGKFSFTVASAGAGTIDVSDTDLWGETSNTAEVNAANPAPVVRNFTAIDENLNTWLFQGNVIGNSVAGLTINFGGLQSLAGQTTTVNSDGSFSFTTTLAACESGTATAQTTQNGNNSNIACATVEASAVALQGPGDQTETDGGVVNLALSATDAVNNALAFQASNLPAGLSINATTGVVSGTVAANADQNGPYAVTVTATDTVLNCGVSTTFTINVSGLS